MSTRQIYVWFLGFIELVRRIVFWLAKTIEEEICYRTVASRVSGVPCDSSYGCFCVAMENVVES